MVMGWLWGGGCGVVVGWLWGGCGVLWGGCGVVSVWLWGSLSLTMPAPLFCFCLSVCLSVCLSLRLCLLLSVYSWQEITSSASAVHAWAQKDAQLFDVWPDRVNHVIRHHIPVISMADYGAEAGGQNYDLA